MFNFPFYNILVAADPFGQQLANAYEPSYPFQEQPEVIREDVPKIEEGTSPGYAVQEPDLLPPKLDITEKSERPERAERGDKGDKVKKGRGKRGSDDDYRPYKRTKANKGIVKQKEDRNLIPNTVHHLLAFVQKQFKSLYLVQKIFSALDHSPRYTITRFYNFHKMLRVKINNYVNQEAMKIITEAGWLDYHQYGIDQQRFYCLVSRILIKKFLKVEAMLMILLSKKVKKQNILDHLNVQRYLYENMRSQDYL